MKKLILSISIFLTTSSVFASGLMVEPYLAYNRGQQSTGRGQGLGYGIRIGGDFSNAFVAGDLGLMDINITGGGTMKYTDIGAVVGVEHTNRYYFGYILQASASDGTTTEKGTGIKIGVGIPLGSKIFFCTEIKTNDYTESTTNSVTTTVKSYATYGSLGLSVVF